MRFIEKVQIGSIAFRYSRNVFHSPTQIIPDRLQMGEDITIGNLFKYRSKQHHTYFYSGHHGLLSGQEVFRGCQYANKDEPLPDHPRILLRQLVHDQYFHGFASSHICKHPFASDQLHSGCGRFKNVETA